MIKLNNFLKGHNSSYKIGEYDFLIKVNYLPLFLIFKLVIVKIVLVNPNPGGNQWNKSFIVRQSESGNEIHALISNYLADTDYFKLI